MSNNTLYDEIYSISIKRLLRLKKEEINKDTVDKSIRLALEFLNIDNRNFEEIEFNKCSAALFKAFRTKIGSSSTISNNDDHENWYDPNVKRSYWDSHKEWLLESFKKPIDVVNEIDKSTDEVLGLLGNPKKDGLWEKFDVDKTLIQTESYQNGKWIITTIN